MCTSYLFCIFSLILNKLFVVNNFRFIKKPVTVKRVHIYLTPSFPIDNTLHEYSAPVTVNESLLIHHY